MTVKRMINSYRSFKDGTLSDWQMGDGLDKCTQCGYYIVRISHRDVAAQGLPFVPADEGHYLVGHLFVSETSSDDKLQTGRGVAQMLLLNDCNNLRADVYCRSGACANGECFWDEWTRLVGNTDLNELENKLQRSVDVGQVSSLDGLTESGIYNGTYSGGVNPFETFVLFVIDNFAAAGATSNVRSVSQFKYALNVDGTFSHKTRTGQGAESIVWGNWVDLGAATTADIQDNSITAQKLSIDVREKLEKVSALEESVAREKSALVNGDTIVGLSREVYSRQGKTDTATFLQRTTAGGTSISDGVATLKQIGGNIVKNLVDGKFNNVTYDARYISVDIADGILKATGLQHSVYHSLSYKDTTKAEHLYYSSVLFYNYNAATVLISNSSGYNQTESDIRGEWAYLSVLSPIYQNFTSVVLRIYPEGDALPVVLFKNWFCIDLTEMYGAGNEPTKEECDKLFGTIDALPQGLTVANPTVLKSTGFNQWNPVNLFTGKTVADNAIVDGDKSIAFFECLPCKIGAGENNGYVIGYGEGDDWSDAGIEVYLTPIYPMTSDGLLYAHKLEKDATTGTYVPKIKGYLLVVTPVTDKLCAHFLWSGDRAKTDYEEYIESTVSLPAIPQMSEWGLAGISSSIGTLVADTIDLDRMVYTKRIGRLKGMDELNWFKGTGGLFYSQQIIGLRDFSNTIITDAGYTQGSYSDGTITITEGSLYLWDSSIESLDELKNLLKDKTLYYHLRTVETYPIVTKAAPNYIGSDYGVEEFTGSKVPLVANILFYMRSLVSETRNFLDRLYSNTAKTDAKGLADYITNAITDVAVIAESVEGYKYVNLLNPDDLLTGYSLSEGNWVTNLNGIFSNKLNLVPGKAYTIKDVPTFQHGELENNAVAIFIAKFNSSDVFLGRDSVKPLESPTLGDGYVAVTYTPTDESVAYYRVLLQSGNNPNHLFDVSRAMIYEGSYVIEEFIPYNPTLVFNYDKVQDARIAILESKITDIPAVEPTDKSGGILLTGASFAYSANSWFAKVCASLNKKAYNKAVSGENIRDTAVKMYNGTLYSKAEFENFDILLLMHVHNQDVCDEKDLQDDYADYNVSATMSYSQAYDYVLKKYAAECYAAKDDSTSKWYGTQYGKPCKVVCMTHWHDARTIFNDSIRRLREKWGFGLVELDKEIGFSKNQVHPVTNAQVSVIHAQDTEVIDGVTYGWHPSRATDAYIQDRIAELVIKHLGR